MGIRFPGLGHVASEGFKNNQWLDGQFIMIGESYFSFAWVPIGMQIFFGRPSPDLILKMLKEDDDDEMSRMRNMAKMSMEETIALMEEHDMKHKDVYEEDGCFQ